MINTHAIYIEKLDAEYKRVFKQVSNYVNANCFDEIRTEEILSEVMDSFLSAQEEGREVSSVTGGDMKAFCKGLCSDVGIKSKLIFFLEHLFPMIIALTGFCCCDLIDFFNTLNKGDGKSFFTFKGETDLLAYLIGVLIFIVSVYIGKAITKNIIFDKPEQYKKFNFLVSLVSLIIFIAVVIFLFKDTETSGTYLWIAMLFCALFFVAYGLITRESRMYKKEYKINFSEFAAKSAVDDGVVEKTEMKRFEKKRKKHPELTFEEFLNNEEKECNRWDKKPPFFICIAICCTVIGFVNILLTDSFEGVLDGLIFIAVMLAVESVVMYGVYKFTRIGTDERLQWIESKRKENNEN